MARSIADSEAKRGEAKRRTISRPVQSYCTKEGKRPKG